MFKLDLEKAEEPEIKFPTSTGSSKKQESSRKTFTYVYWLCQILCVDHNKLWKILQEMNFSDHLTCLPRNLYAGQKATVKPGHGTTDWFQIGTGVCQVCILSPCLFKLYAEYIMQNTRLDETQAWIKIARYTDDKTLWHKAKKELKCLLMKVKEGVKKLA